MASSLKRQTKFAFILDVPKLYSIIILISIAAIIGVSGAVYGIFLQVPKQAYCVDAFGMKSVPVGELPENYYMLTAQHIIMSLGNFAPQTLDTQLAQVRPYLNPDTYHILMIQINKDRAAIQQADLVIVTSGVVCNDIEYREHHGRDFGRVTCRGLRHIYAGTTRLDAHPITVLVDLMPKTPSEFVKPLQVTHLKWPLLKYQSGHITDFNLKEKS